MKRLPLLLCAVLLLAGGRSRADEGMWTLDNLPLAQLKERYDFVPTPEWLEKVRLASVRFNDGGSGSFVSASGLVLTNHHVALGQLEKVSSAEKDYVRDGFFARTPEEELRCPDLEVNQLISMENVTGRVLGAVKAGSPQKEQNEQRKAEMARVEKESTEKTGLRSDVVELYEGGEYWLYRYKKYKDVRLVMAPEMQAAFYGGDPDNFTYPRFDLDMAFFRVYEDGKPVATPYFLRLNPRGAKDGELVFVSGHPGSTNRLNTVAQLEFGRDLMLPARLSSLKLRRKALQDYSARGPEPERRAKDLLFGVENALKARIGEYEGLLDAKLMARLAEREAELRRKVAENPAWASDWGGAWDRIAAAQKEFAGKFRLYYHHKLPSSRLVRIAETLVRYAAETPKSNEKRFKEFRDSALDSLKFSLFSPAPIYPDLEEALLLSNIRESLDALGPEDPVVQALLAGRTPEEAARALISESKLADVALRKKLAEGGSVAIEASKDPLILLARKLDSDYRGLRKWYEDSIESVEALEGGKIAKARFAIHGKSAYPDATFTLRLSHGKVAGYEQGTTRVPSKTTFYGLYDRAESFDGKYPFDLSKAVAAARSDVRLATPLNFVTTNDIIGGNSGSPIFNRDAELVGLIFDGNIQGLILRYAYEEEQSRAVGVHSAGILEGLRAVYRMDGLLKELGFPAL